MMMPMESAQSGGGDEGPPQPPKSGHKKHNASFTKQQNITKANTLSDAKDRAQLTATTAMSVVHVALLRTLLNGGPSSNPYYYLVLVLISVSLAFQVTAGAIALLISHMKAHHKMHTDHSCASFCSNLCRNFLPSSAVNDVPPVDVLIEPSRKADCTSCETKAHDITHDHFSLMRKHDELAVMQIDSSIDATEAAVNLEDLRQKLELLMAAKQNYADSAQNVRKKIEMEIYQLQTFINELEAKVRRSKIIRGQYDIVTDITEDLREHYILQRVTFWQHTMNYMLYFIFVFNSFITGLGVTGHYTPDTDELT